MSRDKDLKKGMEALFQKKVTPEVESNDVYEAKTYKLSLTKDNHKKLKNYCVSNDMTLTELLSKVLEDYIAKNIN